MKKFLIILTLALTACAIPDTEEVTAPAPVEAKAEEVVAEPSPKPKPKPAPEPEPVNDTGSYSSTDEYVDEMLDTSEKMSELFVLVGEVADDVLNGVYSTSEAAMLMDTASEVVQSHLSFYEDRTPPADFRETDRLVVQALDLYVGIFTDYGQCMRTENWSLCEAATARMDDGSALMDRATAALPSSY